MDQWLRLNIRECLESPLFNDCVRVARRLLQLKQIDVFVDFLCKLRRLDDVLARQICKEAAFSVAKTSGVWHGFRFLNQEGINAYNQILKQGFIHSPEDLGFTYNEVEERYDYNEEDFDAEQHEHFYTYKHDIAGMEQEIPNSDVWVELSLVGVPAFILVIDGDENPMGDIEHLRQAGEPRQILGTYKIGDADEEHGLPEMLLHVVNCDSE